MTNFIVKNEHEKIIDINKIKTMIPHRYPMLLVDRVLDIKKGESARGIKCVTFDEWFFQGHFPNQPIMPGVLIIESLAQTAAIVVIDYLDIVGSDKEVYFMSIENAKFRHPVVPGDKLELFVEKEKARDTIWKFKGVAKVEGKTVAEASYTALIKK